MDKKQFVETLFSRAMSAADENIKRLTYYKEETEDEYVEVQFKSGSIKRVNVTCNSLLAIMLNVTEKLCF